MKAEENTTYDLSEVIKSKKQAKEGEIESLETFLSSKHGKKVPSVEYLSLRSIKKRKADITYEQIDIVKFLNQSNEVELDGNFFRVPKYAAFKLHGSNSFSIAYLNQDFLSGYSTGFNCNQYGNCEDDSEKLPLELTDALFKASEFGKFALKRNYRELYSKLNKFDVSWNINKKFFLKKSVIFQTKLEGLFPKNAKENLDQAEKIFEPQELYLISETKPGEWNNDRQSYNTILIGSFHDLSPTYFIDSFELTKPEAQISQKP